MLALRSMIAEGLELGPVLAENMDGLKSGAPESAHSDTPDHCDDDTEKKFLHNLRQT